MPLFHKYTRHFNMSKMFTNTLFLPDSLYSFTALALLNESHTNYIVRPLWCFNVTKPSPPSFLFLRKALKSWWISFICPCVLLPAHIWAVAEDSLGVSADNPSPSFTSWSISYQLLEPADCTHRSHIHQLSPPCSYWLGPDCPRTFSDLLTSLPPAGLSSPFSTGATTVIASKADLITYLTFNCPSSPAIQSRHP